MRLYCVAVVLSCIGLTAAWGEDRCADVLRGGTFRWEHVRDNSYFQQIVWSRFLKSTYQSSKTDREGGFNVPIGEIVLGANYTEEQYNAKKQQIEREYFNQITASREIDVAVTSGDPEVLRAWTQCMSHRGGLALRFEATSPTRVFLTISYFSQGTQYSDTLDADIKLPSGVQVIDGGQYLRKGQIIRAGNPRRVILRLADARTTVEIVANGRNSSDQAWLPARIRLIPQVKPYVFSPEHRLHKWAHKQSGTMRDTVKLTAEEINDGWTFDPATAETNMQLVSVNNRRNRIYNEIKSVTPYTFTFGYSYYAGNRRRRDGHVEGQVSPVIMMRRAIWVPNDVSELREDLPRPELVRAEGLGRAIRSFFGS